MGSLTRYSLLGLLLIIGYFSYLVIKPFISYLLFSLVMVILFHPLYNKILNRINKPRTVSLLLVLMLILLLVIPLYVIVSGVFAQAPDAYESIINGLSLDEINQVLEDALGIEINLQDYLSKSVILVRNYFLSNATSYIQGLASISLGIFMMFFVMYYLLYEGDDFLKSLRKIIPITKKQQEILFNEIQQVIKGTIQGQLFLGVLQGTIGGLVFWLLGFKNPLFWGFVMTILAIIPVVGTFIVWFPAAIYLIVSGFLTKGIILMLLGLLVISQIDNILRPYIVGKTAEIHPIVVMLGVLGGLQIFGFAGFVIGPLILALFVRLISFVSVKTF